MVILTVGVKSLSKPDEIIPAVRVLGLRHVAYGVKDEQRPTVGAALLWSLEQRLGDQFTPEVKAG